MTREEATELVRKIRMDIFKHLDTKELTALDMAIEALEVHDICAEMLESAQPVSIDGDLISRQDIKYHTQLEAMGNGQYKEVEVAYKNDIESLPSAEPLVLTCDGCRHVGTYDTDFPCSGCIRREKDYYEQER